jgi:hypothetical protein
MARLDRAIQEQKTQIFQYNLDGRVNPRVKPEGMLGHRE